MILRLLSQGREKNWNSCHKRISSNVRRIIRLNITSRKNIQLTGKSIETIKFFIASNKIGYLILFFLSILVGFAETLSALAIYPIIEFANSSNLSSNNKYVQSILEYGSRYVEMPPLYIAVLLLFVITFLKIVLQYVYLIYSWVISNRLTARTTIELVENYLKSNYQFTINSERGDFAFRMRSAPGYIGKVINNLIKLNVEVLKILMIVFTLYLLSKNITLIMGSISIFYILISYVISKRSPTVLALEERKVDPYNQAMF